ncbi:helix-turn-helix domain-containing protein [Thalassotalea ganghwensis]
MLIFDFTSFIGFLALAQGVLLACFVVLTYPRLGISWLITVLLLAFVIALGHSVFLHSKLALSFPHILGFGPFSTYLIGPLILLITLKLLRPDKPLSLWHLLHFVPFVIHQLSRLPKIFRSANEKLIFLESFYQQGQITSPSVLTLTELTNMLIFYSHRFIYLILSCWLLKQAKVNTQHFTIARKLLIHMLFYILLGYCIFWLLYRSTFYFPAIAEISKSLSTSINAIGLGALTLLIAVFLFKHRLTDIFSSKSTQKYQKNVLDEDLSKSLLASIEATISKDKLFCLPDFRQADLSNATGLSIAMISQVINKEVGLNFNDYMNEYRINYVKELLADSDQSDKDIQTLALEAGFSSKATFYRVFKEKMQVTPTQYRKQVAQSPSKESR